VCDVYDALVSRRVYREVWSRTDALALLRREACSGFDPWCVEALERVLCREAADTGPRHVPALAGRPPLAGR